MKYLEIGTGANWGETKKQLQAQKPNTEIIGLDILPAFNPDILRDITRGLPFNDNEFDEINCSHCLEHIEYKDGDFVMNEIHRVLKPNGTVTIEVPYFRDDIAVEAAGHCRMFAENSFINYYSNPYWKELGQCCFSEVVSNQLLDTNRSGERPARVIRITLKK